MKKLFRTVIVIAIIAALLYGIIALCKNIYRNIEKTLYPLPNEYISVIEKNAKEYNVPIEILCGVINTESSFDPNAHSTAGAKGMMQITDDTFYWLQFKSGETVSLDELYDYETNIKFGTFFLSLLYEEFGDWDTALAAYNAGRSRVNGWLEDGRYSENGKLTAIPFEETANYVIKVNNAAEKYNKLYFTQTATE